MKERAILEKIVTGCSACLSNLVGVYLHGSLAFGCYRREVSDIDFIAVTEAPPTQTEKRKLLDFILSLTPDVPPKGIEMSVVTLSDCLNFSHPMPYTFHYSEGHRQPAEEDPDAFCRRIGGLDPDLAAHFTVIRAVGITLRGKPIHEVFAPVPWEAYLESIRFDVESAEADILRDPVYVILNLCRVLAAVRDHAVLSKEQGGHWGLANLPSVHHRVIQSALDAYTKDSSPCQDETDLLAFARFMKEQF